MATADSIQTPEVWKTIPGYEGSYEASSLGRIRSLDRVLAHRPSYRRPFGYFRAHWGRIMRQQLDKKTGYLYCLLRIRNGRMFLVHRLIAAAFIGPCPEGVEVNHKDGNKTNNQADNLEYVTKRENALHDIAMGHWSFTTALGESHSRSKLTAEEVLHIRKRLAESTEFGIMTKLANQFGVTHAAISSIKRGLTWKHTT